MKAYIVSLGCPKNLTDTEVLMGKLVASGYTIATEPSQADIIIVNTCAFIKTARDEALKTIREMAKWKKKGKCKKLYMAGCLPKWMKTSPPCLPAGKALSPSPSKMERGKPERSEGGGEEIDGIIDSVGLFDHCTPRIKATPPWYAYVKISEGCNNCCSYCLIPKIRGKLRCRKQNDILKEVEQLAKKGVKELIYVAQDTTAYPNFAGLLIKTAKIPGLHWIRIMYAHPAHLTDKMIKVIAQEKKIVKYLDLPIQHCCDKILKKMNRRYTRLELENLISKIRREIPKIALRTTVIAGFPGEGEAESKELLNFIGKAKFERLGCFAYSREKGTPASNMRGRGSVQKIMRVQARVSREMNKNLIGKTLEILIEKTVRGGFIGRSYMDAPEIDGSVFVGSSLSLKPGGFVKARITGAKTYDLIGFKT